MIKKLRICAIALLVSLSFSTLACSTAKAVDLKQVEQELTSSGVTGWIHGSVGERKLFVFTYRDPKDFFDYIEMSVVAPDPVLLGQLRSLKRHDKVRLKGKFLFNPSPQKHILVSSIETIKPYESAFPAEPYSHLARVPDELLGLTRATFLVHAVGGDGHILVTEYKDAVLPIFVRDAKLTQGLYRGDVIELKFGVQGHPKNPTHLVLDEHGDQPLKVLESIRAKHGKPAVVEGALVLFPKSPEIQFNVFAVQEELPAGLKRQYTLVNFDNPELFKKIRAALQKAWDNAPRQYVNGRNKLISTRIRVKATGTFNEVDPNQANPQILLPSEDSLQIME